MTEVKNMKALSWVKRERVAGERFLRVTREGFLEAVVYLLK